MPVDVSQLDDDLKAIRERRGMDAIRHGDDVVPVDRIAVPSPALMRITSGGIPLGRITRLWGDTSTGKTHLGYIIIAAAQHLRTKEFPKGLAATYWNVEGIYDPVHAQNLGVDIKQLLLQEANIIEDIAAELETLLKSCHVHVIDSASAASCVDELAADVEDWQRMLDARAWKRAIKRIDNALDHRENAVIFIDHSGRDYKTQQEFALGGKALEYRSSMSLHFRKGSWLYYHPEGYLDKDEKIKGDTGLSPSGQKEADGIEVVVRVNKSRVCRPFRVARMRLDLNTFQFDTLFELLDAATFFDEDGNPAHRSLKPAIARKTGAKSSWYELPDGRKVQGDKGLRHALESDASLAALVRQAMLVGN